MVSKMDFIVARIPMMEVGSRENTLKEIDLCWYFTDKKINKIKVIRGVYELMG